MAPLRNPRHERFVQALFEGKTADEAYIEAGFHENRGNASRLKATESIRNRLAELQEAVAATNEVSVGSLLRELEQARQKASNLDQLSAAVRAIEAKAKVSGLLIQRMEVRHVEDFNGCATMAEIIDKLLEFEAPGVSFTAQERARVQELFAAVGEIIENRKAKSVSAPSQRQIELSRGNGFKLIGR